MNVRTIRVTMPVRDDARGPWRKSSYSGGGNNCVEVAAGAATVAVRDSKDPEGGQLVFGASAWTAFTSAIKHGEYGTR
jgi:hypothetical protein